MVKDKRIIVYINNDNWQGLYKMDSLVTGHSFSPTPTVGYCICMYAYCM